MALILSAEQQAIVMELVEARAQQAKLKRRADDLRTELLAALEVGEDGVVAGAGADATLRGIDPDTGRECVTVTPEVRTRVNGAKLKALYPVVWDQCYETQIVTVVRTP